MFLLLDVIDELHNWPNLIANVESVNSLTEIPEQWYIAREHPYAAHPAGSAFR